jgi:hypothetical protein
MEEHPNVSFSRPHSNQTLLLIKPNLSGSFLPSFQIDSKITHS